MIACEEPLNVWLREFVDCRLQVRAAQGPQRCSEEKQAMLHFGPGIVSGPFHPLTFPQRARHDMSTVATPAVSATAPRTIVAEPNETPEISGVRPGGILVFSNRSQKFPTIEIEFIGSSPASPTDILTGTGSVVVHVPPGTVGDFEYKIHHVPTAGATTTTGTFIVRSCITC